MKIFKWTVFILSITGVVLSIVLVCGHRLRGINVPIYEIFHECNGLCGGDVSGIGNLIQDKNITVIRTKYGDIIPKFEFDFSICKKPNIHFQGHLHRSFFNGKVYMTKMDLLRHDAPLEKGDRDCWYVSDDYLSKLNLN